MPNRENFIIAHFTDKLLDEQQAWFIVGMNYYFLTRLGR